MSDYNNESLDDSFESASDSDNAVAGEEEYLHTQNEANLKIRRSGMELPSYVRREFQLLSGAGPRSQSDSVTSDHVDDDWR